MTQVILMDTDATFLHDISELHGYFDYMELQGVHLHVESTDQNSISGAYMGAAIDMYWRGGLRAEVPNTVRNGRNVYVKAHL